jgi:alkylresorcinol/alkylpyrone synthase
VEVCSAAFYLDDDPGVLVSACLFGDGAAAAVVAREPAKTGRPVEWKDCWSVLRPEHRDLLRFEQRGGMLRNILSLRVPEVAAREVSALFERMSAVAGVPKADVAGWILHAGGKNVLEALRGRLGLSESQTEWSAGVLREYGNVSSPFVLFTLQAALQAGAPPGWWWMTSFGAGFSCAGAFLRVG